MASRRRPLRRPRTNQVPPAQVLLRGGVVTVLLVGFIAFAVTLYSGVPGRSYVNVQARVPVVGNLIQHDPVRVAGVRVGQVAGVGTTADGRALLKLKLDPGTRLPADTSVVVRANGLLGGRFVQLVPGRSTQELRDGGDIRAAAQSITFGVPETLDTLDAKTRGRLQDMLAGLGKGLAGRGGGLNTFFRRASDEITHAQDLIETTLAPRGSVAALLPSLRAGVAPLDANRQNLTDLFGATADALQPFVTERADVRSLLAAAPPSLQAADAGLGKGVRLLAAVRMVADAARRTLPPAPRGLHAAAALLREAGTPLDRTGALLKEAGRTVPPVLRVADALRPALPGLRSASDDLTPMVTTLGVYGCDIVNLGTTFRSMTGSGGTGSGPNGPLKNFRLQAVIPALGEVTQASDHSGVLLKDGYPAPCKYGPTTYPHVPKP